MAQKMTEEFKNALRKATKVVQAEIIKDDPDAKAMLIVNGERPHYIEVDGQYPENGVVVAVGEEEFTVPVVSTQPQHG